MNLKPDENLPLALAAPLRALGHDVQTVPAEDLAGHDDPSLWRAARAEGRFFVAQDLNFSDIRTFAPGTHPGILLIRLAQPGRKALFRRIVEISQREGIHEWVGCFVVTTEHKVRVRRGLIGGRR